MTEDNGNGNCEEVRAVERDLLVVLQKHPASTIYFLEKEINLDYNSIKYWVKKMLDKNLVVEEVEGRKTKYSVNEDYVSIREGIMTIEFEDSIIVICEPGATIDIKT